MSMDGNNRRTNDDTCSCFVAMSTFSFFASMTLILGFCGAQVFLFGPNTSWILQANSFMAQDIRVSTSEDRTSSAAGAIVYGFRKAPHLNDARTTWTETHTLSIPPGAHQEWSHYLNGGAQINVSYSIRGDSDSDSDSYSSTQLSLAIVEGKQSLLEWRDDPLTPHTTLSWNLIHGNGSVQQELGSRSSDYYIAVANVNEEESPVEVHFTFSIQAWLYNLNGAYYECSLSQQTPCSAKLFLFVPNTILITTGAGGDREWDVSVSFTPRWSAYFVGSGVLLLTVLLLSKLMWSLVEGERTETTAAPLLPDHKDDEDEVSTGSSYDSVSQHDDVDDAKADKEQGGEGGGGRLDPISTREDGGGGSGESSGHLCVLCCDAPRDCFFLPCGHSATCFPCGKMLTEEDGGRCPFCRRRMKKVRKIFAI